MNGCPHKAGSIIRYASLEDHSFVRDDHSDNLLEKYILRCTGQSIFRSSEMGKKLQFQGSVNLLEASESLSDLEDTKAVQFVASS